MKLRCHSLRSKFYVPWMYFPAKGNSLVLLCNLYHPKTLKQSVSWSDLHQIVQIFCLRCHRFNSKFSVFPKQLFLTRDRFIPGRKSLCFSKHRILVFIKQFFTKSLSFFCIVFIKISWTFLPLTNILFWQGNSPFQVGGVQSHPKANFPHITANMRLNCPVSSSLWS